mmetsp:Transcript_23406/g.67444  ORF Transcript_23406/g.67444 Transcript_23406/m.67444 type:complete len:235 (+) Transcript_23406:144-848(+)|eukprot:CAMPEP_0181048214 /NCGR_PEP_ID=MMETSP1070-20121207/15311_1 /TAXON_ID=265543 /ORGANISM="Minutocellus polymorphus, Strain NH13" /LENGTH=234 /DNA_ID=CAMNT_0023126973 /DNA_START=96 /DNA_END=800 /DNA_ORIENTATION=-
MTRTFPPKETTTMPSGTSVTATSNFDAAAAAAAAAPRRSSASLTSSSTNDAADESTSRRHRRRRRVAFKETTRILIVPGLWQYPEKVKTDIFYKHDDYLDMKDDIRRCARAARKGREGAGDCIRGIEHLRSRSHMEERRSAQLDVFGAVLTTQDRQRQDGRSETAEIARASMCRTRKAKDRARDFAMQDEEDAGQIYAATNRDASTNAIFAALNAELGNNLATMKCLKSVHVEK